MNMEAVQIAEMAECCCYPCRFCDVDGSCSEKIVPSECPLAHGAASKLYAAGYRKQVKGVWIGIFYYNCSVCTGESKYKTQYCPHCGAEMEGGVFNGTK